MAEEKKKSGKRKETVMGQPRVPNIKKGYDPNYPFYMMGIFFGFAALSAIFAFLTD